MRTLPIRVRRAATADLEAILALEQVTDHAPHWASAAYRAILDEPVVEPSDATIQRCLFVAEAVAQTDSVAQMNEAAWTSERLLGFAVGLLHPASGDPVGVAAGPTDAASQTERVAELESVVVALDARRLGIGRTLCRAVLDWCRQQGATELVLEVRANSSDALALYASLGFVVAGRRPRYYRAPDDDALILRLGCTALDFFLR